MHPAESMTNSDLYITRVDLVDAGRASSSICLSRQKSKHAQRTQVTIVVHICCICILHAEHEWILFSGTDSLALFYQILPQRCLPSASAPISPWSPIAYDANTISAAHWQNVESTSAPNQQICRFGVRGLARITEIESRLVYWNISAINQSDTRT